MKFGNLGLRRLLVPFLLGLVFFIFSALLLAIVVSVGGQPASHFIPLLGTYLLYFAVLLFLPSVPLFYLLNRWGAGFLSC
jgi:hypothetical protein